MPFKHSVYLLKIFLYSILCKSNVFKNSKEPCYSHIFNKTYKDTIYSYFRSCKNAACYRKKLKDLKCEKCGLQHEENAAEKSLVGSIIINSDRKFTLFTQHAESLKSQLNISDDILSPNFHSRLITLLPIKAQIENIGDKVMRINVIHD